MPANTETNTNSKNGSKKKSKLASIFVIALDIIIILAAVGAVFYFIIYNNIGGMSDKYYTTIKKIPVMRHALHEPSDPSDPEYMTEREIKNKYIELKNENEQLKKQLSEAEAKQKKLQTYKDDYDQLTQQAQAKLEELVKREADVEQKEKELKELQLKVEEAIANGDTDAFVEYYKSIDPDNAAALYESAIKKQQVNENVKNFAKIYAEMEPGSAAAIFERLGTSRLDMITETLQAMNRENASQIIQSMSADFAAKVTEKLNELYKGK